MSDLRIDRVREHESPADLDYWQSTPQRLLDYVSEYVEGSMAPPQRPGRLPPAKLAEDVRGARTGWVGRMTSFSLRAVLDMLRAVPSDLVSASVPRRDFLQHLRAVNSKRWDAWAEGKTTSDSYLATELGGEVGEVLNEVKKLEREKLGWRGSRTSVEKLGEEMGDVLITLDSLARRYGIDLAEVTAKKFNATSEKVGLPHRLSTGPDERLGSLVVAARRVVYADAPDDSSLLSDLEAAAEKYSEDYPWEGQEDA